jgi:hypothetical protein
MRALALALLVATPALADCPGEVIFSCHIKAKVLQVCLTPDSVSYQFGRPSRPDLTITTDLVQADFTPWPGFGRTMWQSVRFQNEDVTYEVWSSIDKMMNADDPEPLWQGWVIVTRGDEALADLTCTAPPDPPWLDRLYEAKQAVGQCLDFDTQTWGDCP